MLIFIDTNIFFHHWQLRNADFTYLFNFIENDEGKLLISDLVVSEVESNRSREFQSAASSVNKTIRQLNGWCAHHVNADGIDANMSYDFRSVLENKIDTDYIDYINYEHLSQLEVVSRAIAGKRPFRENEKGYRDTLIWLSFLQYLRNNATDEKEQVAFITKNIQDFQNGGRNNFHEDLLADIKSYGIKREIKFYNSLFSFISSNFKKEDHALSHNELDKIEDAIEEWTLDAVSAWTTEEFKKHTSSQWPVISTLLSIEEHEFIIAEGIEDAEVINYEHSVGKLYYLSCHYNFRRAIVKFTLSKAEFEQKKSLFDYYNWEELNAEFVSVELYARIYFSSSLIYEPTERSINSLTIQETGYR